ncbi:MAG: hypothetical protein GX061_08865 [Eubacteriaceae bacterium]|nr:hypothetical protein [Eubacteriaceae bacterium]
MQNGKENKLMALIIELSFKNYLRNMMFLPKVSLKVDYFISAKDLPGAVWLKQRVLMALEMTRIPRSGNSASSYTFV